LADFANFVQTGTCSIVVSLASCGVELSQPIMAEAVSVKIDPSLSEGQRNLFGRDSKCQCLGRRSASMRPIFELRQIPLIHWCVSGLAPCRPKRSLEWGLESVVLGTCGLCV
jgi:hypothetical protein